MTLSKAQELCYKLATLRLAKDPKARTQPQSSAWLKPAARLLDDQSFGHVAAVLEWVYDYGDWESTAKTPALFKAHFYSINEAMKIEREVRRSRYSVPLRYNPLLKAIKAVLVRSRTIGGRP